MIFMRQLRRLAPPTIAVLAALLLLACSDTSTNFGRFFKGRTLHISVVEIKQAPEIRYATIDPDDVIRHYRLIPSEKDLELVLVRMKVQNHTATSAIFTVDQQGAELRDFFRGTYQPLDVNNVVLQDLRGQSTAAVRVNSGQCFDPRRMNVTLGTVVDWVNDDEVDQVVRLGAVAGQSETAEPTTLGPGESLTFTFNQVGDWEYQCGDSELTEGMASVLVEEENDGYAVDEQAIEFITGPFELLRDMGIDGWMVFEAPKGTKFRSIRWRAGDSITIDF
jgi:plastocyanin